MEGVLEFIGLAILLTLDTIFIVYQIKWAKEEIVERCSISCLALTCTCDCHKRGGK